MSIFTVIRNAYRFNTPTAVTKQSGVGELSSLSKDPFELATYRYPADGLGDTDAPHYMMFNINIPTGSKYVTTEADDRADLSSDSASTQDFDYRVQQGVASDNPATGTPFVVGAFKGVPSLISSNFNLPGAVAKGTAAGLGSKVVKDNIKIRPQLHRIATSIALYMPDTQLTAQFEHDWGTDSLTSALGLTGLASAYQGELKDVFGGGLKQDVENVWTTAKNFLNGSLFNTAGLAGGQGAELAGAIAQKSGATNDITGLIMRSRGRALNPQVQMLFRGTANREFVFEFDLQPRSQDEATTIKNIINTFKRFAAPELAREGAGRYFIPPAQFDIKFFFKDKENPFIGKISTCALVNVTVDYNRSPPFASFGDGSPVHIQLQLRFREVDVLTRELIEHFGY